ncbi:MAG: SemiSWEET family transporter [Candidatus Woesearchaeota archaeon]
MIIDIFAVLVLIVGVIMSLGHIIQAYKLYKRKSAEDISFTFVIIFLVGTYIWLIYGLLIKDIVITISFLVGAIGTTMLTILKVKYSKNKKHIN